MNLSERSRLAFIFPDEDHLFLNHLGERNALGKMHDAMIVSLVVAQDRPLNVIAFAVAKEDLSFERAALGRGERVFAVELQSAFGRVDDLELNTVDEHSGPV